MIMISFATHYTPSFHSNGHRFSFVTYSKYFFFNKKSGTGINWVAAKGRYGAEKSYLIPRKI